MRTKPKFLRSHQGRLAEAIGLGEIGDGVVPAIMDMLAADDPDFDRTMFRTWARRARSTREIYIPQTGA